MRRFLDAFAATHSTCALCQQCLEKASRNGVGNRDCQAPCRPLSPLGPRASSRRPGAHRTLYATRCRTRPVADVSPSAWAKIRDELANFMQEIRNTRLRREHPALLRKNLALLDEAVSKMRATHPSVESDPKFIDYATMPECRALLDAPEEPVDPDGDAFQDLLGGLPRLKARWLAQQEEHLAKMLEAAMGGVPASIAGSSQGGCDKSEQYTRLLELAVSVFECRRCKMRMGARSALGHRCARRPDQPWSLYPVAAGLVFAPGTYLYEVWKFYPKLCPWSHECFTVPDPEPLRGILRACGWDPDVVTADEVDAPGQCLASTDADGRITPMKWEYVVSDAW